MLESQKLFITYGVFAAIWYVLQTIGHRGIFKKAGVSQGKAFIPVVRELEMFKLSWNNKKAGLIWLGCAVVGIVGLYVGSMLKVQILAWIGFAALIAMLVLMVMRDIKQSHAFGRSGGMTAGLILLNPVFNVVLGVNTVEYKGVVA